MYQSANRVKNPTQNDSPTVESQTHTLLATSARDIARWGFAFTTAFNVKSHIKTVTTFKRRPVLSELSCFLLRKTPKASHESAHLEHDVKQADRAHITVSTDLAAEGSRPNAAGTAMAALKFATLRAVFAIATCITPTCQYHKIFVTEKNC
jgi:hypothetical protein